MDELELEFSLDERLHKDCIVIGDFPLSRLLLMNDARYPWFILVPRRAGATELYHLAETDRAQLMEESAELAETMADCFNADKMNVAALGNQVAQLHIHHIARRKHDSAWPQPVWNNTPAQAYTAEEIAAVRSKLCSMLNSELNDCQPCSPT